MGFLQPLALLGLAAVALPALLHLLARRTPPTVPFPAVRYLAEAHQRHSRRMRLRHLLLLILRTAVIVLLVLAAARPVTRAVAGGSGHEPAALAIVVDNSLSSGVVVDGRRLLDTLILEARLVMDRVTAHDRVWLVPADGVPRTVSPGAGSAMLDQILPEPVRLDLGDAIRAAARLVADDPRLGEVVVFSDAQRSAVSTGEVTVAPVLVWAPPPMPDNLGVDSAWVQPGSWSPGGIVGAALGGGGGPVEVTLEIDGRTVARSLASAGEQVALAASLPRSGWFRAAVRLAPDELRGDDVRHVALHAGSPAGVTVGDGAGRFVADAVHVLRMGGRLGEGADVAIRDELHSGPHVVIPPAEAARVGDLNRALSARGVPWRFGAAVNGEWVASGESAEGSRVFRRHRLSGDGVVLARVGGEPWIVRSGDVVLVGSRLEEGWTDLPVSAGFVPFIDRLLNGVATGEVRRLESAPGDLMTAPEGAVAMLGLQVAVPVPGDRRLVTPREPGVYFLSGPGGDTLAALEVNHDRRETLLDPVDRATLVAGLGPDVLLAEGPVIHREVFRGAGRVELASWLLVAALAVLAAEFAVAASTGGMRET